MSSERYGLKKRATKAEPKRKKKALNTSASSQYISEAIPHIMTDGELTNLVSMVHGVGPLERKELPRYPNQKALYSTSTADDLLTLTNLYKAYPIDGIGRRWWPKPVMTSCYNAITKILQEEWLNDLDMEVILSLIIIDSPKDRFRGDKRHLRTRRQLPRVIIVINSFGSNEDRVERAKRSLTLMREAWEKFPDHYHSSAPVRAMLPPMPPQGDGVNKSTLPLQEAYLEKHAGEFVTRAVPKDPSPLQLSPNPLTPEALTPEPPVPNPRVTRRTKAKKPPVSPDQKALKYVRMGIDKFISGTVSRLYDSKLSRHPPAMYRQTMYESGQWHTPYVWEGDETSDLNHRALPYHAQGWKGWDELERHVTRIEKAFNRDGPYYMKGS
ncbi:hypothetical protein TruAng_011654 [Truncatella angustata]|nr:hypothetical protein TruAng_011654 [Truncatella angustata]